jgi:LPXTG-site transpeptidase (sortase) family protein
VEPDLDIEKTNALVSSNCVDLNDASGTSYNNCIGATIGYTLKITNPYYEADGTTRTYSSVAWDSVISDTIPAGLTLNELSLRAERVDTTSGSEVRTSVGSVGSGWILDYTAPTITLTAEAGRRFDVNDDVWYEIIYQAVIDQNASAIGVTPVVDNVPLPGDVLKNTAKVDWTNKDGVVPGEKTYSESTDSSVTVENGELVVDKYDATFEITGTNSTLQPNAKIYYGIRFQNTGNVPTKFSLSEDLPANTTYDAALTDTTNGVTGSSWTLNSTTGEYEAVPVTAAGAGILAEAGATDAGTGNPSDRGVWYFVVTIDDPLPAGVHEINNVATVYMDENSGGPEPKPGDNKDTSDLEAVGEPSLSITKTNNKDTTTLGDTLVYTITYRNTGGQNATGVVLTETVPAGTTWFNDPGVTTDDGWVCDAVGAAGETCEWTIGALAAHPTDVHTVTFAVKVDDVTSVDFVDNTVTVEDDGNNNTTPGSPPQSATDTDQDILIQGMEKHLLSISEPAATTFNPTGNDAAIGSILVYEVTIDIPSTPGSDDIVVPNFVLTDVLDQGLAFLGCGDGSGADAVTADANLTTSAGAFVDLCDKATAAQPTTTTGNSPTVGEYPIGSGEALNQGRMLTFDFGTLTNDNSSSTTQTITIVYRAVVLNDASVVVGSGERNNQVNADWDDVTTPMTDEAESVEIVEPFLNIQKTVSRSIVPVGGTVQYKLTIFHESRSTTSAYDVNVFDTLPLTLEYVVGSENHVSGETPDSMTYDPATRTLTIAYDDWDPTVNQDSVITFDATVNFYSGGGIVNQANVEWTSLPGDFETVQQSPFNSLSNERYYDPLDDVDVYGANSSISIEPPYKLPETGFALDKITTVPNQPDNLQYSKTDNLVLEIPALNVKAKIVGIPEYQNTWDATWLQDDIGYLTGTAFPTQAGRTLLAGHVVDAQGAPSVFADLKTLHWGDEFVIYANGLKYVYQVQSNERIKADNMDIYKSSAYDEVSLITCQGYNEATGEYDWRIAVTGVLIRLEK